MTTPTQTGDKPMVTQRARDAAADMWLAAHSDHDEVASWQAEWMKSGTADEGPIVQAFARFEQETLSPEQAIDVERAFALGQRVGKIKGSSWQGRVVGFYSTALTPVGYAVESERETGSVQIYPESALAALPPASPEQPGERPCRHCNGTDPHCSVCEGVGTLPVFCDPIDTIQRLGQEFDGPEASPSLGMGEAHGDRKCDACHRDNPVWFAPSPLWNLVIGGPEATDDPGGVLCPICFIEKAEAAGIMPATGAWLVTKEPAASLSPPSPAPPTSDAGARDGVDEEEALLADANAWYSSVQLCGALIGSTDETCALPNAHDGVCATLTAPPEPTP